MAFSGQIGSMDFRYILVLADAFGFRPTRPGWYQLDNSPQAPAPEQMRWWNWESLILEFTQEEAIAASIALRKCLDWHLSTLPGSVPDDTDCQVAIDYEQLRQFVCRPRVYDTIERIQQVFALGTVRWIHRVGKTDFISEAHDITLPSDDVAFENGILIEGYDLERALCFAAALGFFPTDKAWQIPGEERYFDLWWKRWPEIASISQHDADTLAKKLREVIDRYLRPPTPSVPYQAMCARGAEYNNYRQWVISGEALKSCLRLTLACDLGAMNLFTSGTQVRLRPNIDANGV